MANRNTPIASFRPPTKSRVIHCIDKLKYRTTIASIEYRFPWTDRLLFEDFANTTPASYSV